MRMKSLLAVAATIALAVPSAASVAAPPATDMEQGQAVKPKTAPEIAPPPAGLGQVVFYRPSSMGALISCRVHEADQVVNKLPPGKYFVHQTVPGVHEYSVKSEAKDTLRVAVEEGETHYARCAINMGIIAGRPNLSSQDRADFDKRGKKLKLQPPFEARDDKDDTVPAEAATESGN